MTIQQAIITLVSAIISGVLATAITLLISAHKEKIHTRQALVDDIFGYKYQLTDNAGKIDINGKGFARAMNRIVIVFNDERLVLEACDKFYDTLSIADVRERKVKSDEAIIILLKELCKASNIKCDNWNDSRFTRVFNI